jgi:hypothetical protein
MVKPNYELAQVIQHHQANYYKQHRPHAHIAKVLQAILQCRTQALGGHVDGCNTCGHLRISYNSCGNRHCPKCQTTQKERWIEKRESDLLNTHYFHVVFTLPQELNKYCLQYPIALYNLFFKASSDTIKTFAADEKHLGAQVGMISVLHTWGQNLSLHPHVHMIVPSGGVSRAGFWKPSKYKRDFLFPVKALSKVYRAKFMEGFRQLLTSQKQELNKTLREILYQKSWVVYAKQPFAGPKQVIEYLGRYSHKIAISNHRLLDVNNQTVKFTYKDYRSGGQQKVMELSGVEFLRRFSMHILPAGFRKIRHYGILASRNKPKLRTQQMQMGIIPKRQQALITWQQMLLQKHGIDIEKCPCCKTGVMIRLMSFEANAPPLALLHQARQQALNIA